MDKVPADNILNDRTMALHEALGAIRSSSTGTTEQEFDEELTRRN